MNCINLKRGFNKTQCKRIKKEINIKECNKYDCPYFEYENRKYKKIQAKKTIKKVSKKRITVSDDTYNIVYNRYDGRCGLCGIVDNIQLHHILYKSERKDLIDEPSNCIMLCHQDFSKNKCHRIVHQNKKKYQSILIDIASKHK